MEQKESSPAFFRLFFNEGIYRVPETKKYDPAINSNPEILSEKGSDYGTFIHFFEGKTAKTLLLFNYEGSEGIPAQDKIFLEQILRAAGLDFDSVSRLNTAALKGKFSWEDIALNSAADFIIAFGVAAQYMPSGIGEGQIYNIDDKRILYAAALNDLSANNLRKKLLWQGMKEIYGL
jgi:DNA polymerase III psi subunit